MRIISSGSRGPTVQIRIQSLELRQNVCARTVEGREIRRPKHLVDGIPSRTNVAFFRVSSINISRSSVVTLRRKTYLQI